MTATENIFAKAMSAKLIACGERYNTLRDLLQDVFDEATLGDSILKPELEAKIEQALAANPRVDIPAATCSECGVKNPHLGHRDYCSKNDVYDVTLIALRKK